MVPKYSHAHSHSHSTHQHQHPSPRTRSRSSSLSIARSPSVLSSGTIFAPPIISPIDLELGNTSISASASVAGPHSAAATGGGGGGYGLRRVVSNHSRLPGFTTLGPIASAEDLTALNHGLPQDQDQGQGGKDDIDMGHRREGGKWHAYGRDQSDKLNIEDDDGDEEEDDYEDEEDTVSKRKSDEAPLLSSTYAHSVPTPAPNPKVQFDFAPSSSPANYSPNNPHTKPSLNLNNTARTHITPSSPMNSDADTENENDEIIYEGPFQPPDSRELIGILASISAVLVLALAAGMTTIYDWVL